jgi:hypothetical protein
MFPVVIISRRIAAPNKHPDKSKLPMKKLLFSLSCALALTGSLAYAQTSSSSTTSTTTSDGVNQRTETTTTESVGTITEYTPGASIILRTEAAEPVHYKFSKSVTYVTPDGKVIEASKVRKNSKVRVHYSKEGSDMLVDKVVVMED